MDVLSKRIIYPELHAALGWGILLGFVELLPRSLFLGAMIVAEGVLLGKEALFDPVVEGSSEPFLWSGATDLLFYQVGFLIASIMLALPGRG